MNDDLFVRVKDIPTLDVVSRFFPELHLKRDGNRAKALCLFHSESTPSLTIFSDGFKCFGCGESGSNIDLLLKTGKADSPLDAAKLIADAFGIAIASKK